ncbi:MAG: hypothetical protein MJY84_07945 [Bacteroidales bacterium]|nr:hypothetical protein [Bacteroidales bacterium]
MAEGKEKIVLDADVIIHFAKGEMLSSLPSVFPECEFVVLDIVRHEVKQPTLNQLQNQIAFLQNISEVTFGETQEQRVEYARLVSVVGLGRGESACMVYCRYNDDVVGSSNLRDIADYCDKYNIKYLTTLDFLYYGIKRGVWSKEDAEEFVDKVNKRGSRLPSVDFDCYVCKKMP